MGSDFFTPALVQERLDHAHGLLDLGCPLLSSLFVFSLSLTLVVHCSGGLPGFVVTRAVLSLV